MIRTCTYTGRVVGDLAHGQPVEPGWSGDVDLSEPHNQQLVDAGKLIVHGDQPETKSKQSKSKAAKEPLDTPRAEADKEAQS